MYELTLKKQPYLQSEKSKAAIMAELTCTSSRLKCSSKLVTHSPQNHWRQWNSTRALDTAIVSCREHTRVARRTGKLRTLRLALPRLEKLCMQLPVYPGCSQVAYLVHCRCDVDLLGCACSLA